MAPFAVALTSILCLTAVKAQNDATADTSAAPSSTILPTLVLTPAPTMIEGSPSPTPLTALKAQNDTTADTSAAPSSTILPTLVLTAAPTMIAVRPSLTPTSAVPTSSPTLSQHMSPTFPEENNTCQNTPGFVACNESDLSCVGLALVHCCRCKMECYTFCGYSETSSSNPNPCSDSSSPDEERNDDLPYGRSAVQEVDTDGPVSFLRFVFSAIGITFCLISVVIAIRSRHEGRDLRYARRRMAERRRQQREQRQDSANGGVHQTTPTPEDEQARYEKIVSAFYFQKVLKDKSNITASSFMDAEKSVEEGEDGEEVEAEGAAVGEIKTETTGLAEFFPWTKTASKDECCICLECYAPDENICVPITEGCNHVLHEECMVEWLKTHNECPLCRVQLLSD